ncbi:MAG: high-affinity iron transporter [Cycloclasticus sp.]|jgi:high-affinity iron transporter
MNYSRFSLVLLILLSRPIFADTQQLLQLIDYVGVDYAVAIDQGEVINQGEYEEMQDFAAGIVQQVGALPEQTIKAELIKQAGLLSQVIMEKRPAEDIRQLTVQMQRQITTAYKVVVVPRKQPDLLKAQRQYQQLCASCHGVGGGGDGPAAVGMEPEPINFKDVERYQQRSVFGLYSTITQGVADTAMPAYGHLSEEERWSLAFYLGGMASQSKVVDVTGSPLLELKTMTTTTPAQAQQLDTEKGADIMAYLRHHPELFYGKKSNLSFTKQKLLDALAAYKNGDIEMAYQAAVEAYLEGFELEEQNIKALDKALMLEIEAAMTGLRNKIRLNESAELIENEILLINQKLTLAEPLLSDTSLSGMTAFSSAFFILLREGLEALLIVAALIAFLIRTERRDGLRYIHIGWISALIMGVITWWVSLSLVTISGASREITEGLAAIVAAVVLLYVGFWMHSKVSAAKWKKFIDDNMQKALDSGTLWTLTGLSFIAVYREAFETILFYQALWVQTNEAGKAMGLGGFMAALAVLVVAAWLIMRYSARLPLRQFFAVTGALMFILAVVFAGKGVAALQEAGLIISTPVNFIRLDLFGIYPNLQGLLVQLSMIILAVILWNKTSAKD